MKLTKYLLPVALATVMTACDTCDLSPVIPPIVPPEATAEATMTILEFKQQYWTSDVNSAQKIGLNADGDSIILKGRVVSSDAAGNIYKAFVIRDETAALSFSVNQTDLYKAYQYGQEVAVNVTGLYAGKYRSLFQVGGNGNTETTFADKEQFKAAAQSGGWADPTAVEPFTVDIETLKSVKTSAEGLQEWQSQLVTIEGLTFENAGMQFAPTQNENRYLRDSQGNRINLRCSSYSDFAEEVIPGGTGSVTGILSYYGASEANADWQMLLIDLDGLKGFDAVTPGEDPGAGSGDGSESKPYSVSQAIAKSGSGNAWVSGYIVGTMNSNNNYTLEVTAPFTVASNVYIADKADEDATSKMLPVQLVSGSEIRKAVNLVDNPGNLGKTLAIQGSLETYFSQPGLKSPTAYKLDGEGSGTVTPPTPPAELESFVRATSVSDGKYIIWADNKIGKAFTDGYNYGYMQSADCVPAADGTISASSGDLYTFTQEAKGWTIADAHGQYLYQDTEHESFQLSKTPDTSSDYTYWTITPAADGSFTIVNCGTGNTMRYDAGYKTFAGYRDASKGTAVYLYQSAK